MQSSIWPSLVTATCISPRNQVFSGRVSWVPTHCSRGVRHCGALLRRVSHDSWKQAAVWTWEDLWNALSHAQT